MNLVGKIFTVLIFVMSLVFMTFAVAVYATHVNWRDVVLLQTPKAGEKLGLKYQLDDAKKRQQELEDKLTKSEQALAAEQATKRASLAKLETENADLRRTLDALEKEQAKLVEDTRASVKAMQDTQNTLAALRDEIGTLRKDIQTADQERDASFKSVVQLTDELHQANNDLKALKERSAVLAQDVAKYRQTITRLGFDPDREYAEKAPPVRGEVVATPEEGLVEISIGSDDGLQQGHQLDVYRTAGGTSAYLGKVVIVRTADDRSVAKIDPSTRQGAIQRGDRVVSQLQ